MGENDFPFFVSRGCISKGRRPRLCPTQKVLIQSIRMTRAPTGRLSTTANPAFGMGRQRLRLPDRRCRDPSTHDFVVRVTSVSISPVDPPSYVVGLIGSLQGSRPTHSDTRAAAETKVKNLTGAVEIKTRNTESRDGGTLFAAVTYTNAHLTALRAALSPRTSLLFPG